MPHGDITQRIEYSEKYFDETSEYRHVILPRELAKQLPKNRLLSEAEWRGIGVQQSRGWEHYAVSINYGLTGWLASGQHPLAITSRSRFFLQQQA